MRLTSVQQQLLYCISERGRVQSLLRLTGEICVDYHHARRCVIRLELYGLITVQRSAGHPLILEATKGSAKICATVLRGFQSTNHKPQSQEHANG